MNFPFGFMEVGSQVRSSANEGLEIFVLTWPVVFLVLQKVWLAILLSYP